VISLEKQFGTNATAVASPDTAEISHRFSPLRRAILGAMLAGITLPRLALAQQKDNPASQEPTDMKIRMTSNNQSLTATLYDNPSARDFYSLLPLDLVIDNYANNEKIA
jgi:hypothetical protein